DMVGNRGRPAGGAKVYGVVFAEPVERILRHHAAVPGIGVAAPVELVELPLNIEFAAYCLERAQTFRHHFLADAISGNYCDPEFFHDCRRARIEGETECFD